MILHIFAADISSWVDVQQFYVNYVFANIQKGVFSHFQSLFIDMILHKMWSKQMAT